MTSPDRSPADRTRTVEIPERTARAIATRLRGTEFESVDGYVAFALEQLLRELDRVADGDAGSNPESPSRTTDDGGCGEESTDGATDDAVAERLESLGYL